MSAGLRARASCEHSHGSGTVASGLLLLRSSEAQDEETSRAFPLGRLVGLCRLLPWAPLPFSRDAVRRHVHYLKQVLA